MVPPLRVWGEHHPKAFSFGSTTDVLFPGYGASNTNTNKQTHTQIKRGNKKHPSAPQPPFKPSKPWYLGITDTGEKHGQTGRGALRWPLRKNGMTLIFPGLTTNAPQIKSLLFAVTFPFPSSLREIMPSFLRRPWQAILHQNKRPSSGVTKSQYGQLVHVLEASHSNCFATVVHAARYGEPELGHFD